MSDDIVELAGSLIFEEGKLLLLYRDDEGHWEVPGGKVEEKESPTNAAVRETGEEIGVKISLDKPFYSGEFQHNEKIFLWHGYIANIEEGEPELCEDKFSKLNWFETSNLDDIELAPNLDMILPALRNV